MNNRPAAIISDRPASREFYLLARHRIGRRGTWLVLAIVPFGLGAYFNWQWLVAAGIAPLLVAVAPCLAMCALGLCMHRGKSRSSQPGAHGPVNAVPDQSMGER